MSIKDEILWEKVETLFYPVHVWRLLAFSIASNNSPIVEVACWEIRTRQEAFLFKISSAHFFWPLPCASPFLYCGKGFLKCKVFGCRERRTRQEVFFSENKQFLASIWVHTDSGHVLIPCMRERLLKCGMFWCRDCRTSQEAAMVSW